VGEDPQTVPLPQGRYGRRNRRPIEWTPVGDYIVVLLYEMIGNDAGDHFAIVT
jgi:hypothetical protein